MLKRSGNPPDTSGGKKVKAKKAHNLRKVFGLGVLSAIILAMALPQPAFAAAWAHKKQITINAAKVPSDQTNFPVLISITDTDLRDDAQDNGNDICFTTNPDETNPANRLSHEIEYFDGVTTGKLVAWVKIPDLSGSSDTNIYMHYGNSTCSSMQDATGVWDSNYKMVQHLEETSKTAGTYNDHLDSTSNDNDGEAEMEEAHMDATGKIDGADDFDGTNDYVEVADAYSLDLDVSQGYTLTAWIKLDNDIIHGTVYDDQYILSKRSQYTIEFDEDIYDGKLYHYYKSGGNWGCVKTTKDSWNAGQWYYVTVTHNGTTMRIYVDGSENGSKGRSGAADTGTEPFRIGFYPGHPYFDGIIDEVRISSTTRATKQWGQAILSKR